MNGFKNLSEPSNVLSESNNGKIQKEIPCRQEYEDKTEVLKWKTRSTSLINP